MTGWAWSATAPARRMLLDFFFEGRRVLHAAPVGKSVCQAVFLLLAVPRFFTSQRWSGGVPLARFRPGHPVPLHLIPSRDRARRRASCRDRAPCLVIFVITQIESLTAGSFFHRKLKGSFLFSGRRRAFSHPSTTTMGAPQNGERGKPRRIWFQKKTAPNHPRVLHAFYYCNLHGEKKRATLTSCSNAGGHSPAGEGTRLH